MTWGSESWDSLDDFGSTATPAQSGPRNFYMPAQVTKRVLFITEAPFTFWQHSLYEITRSGKDKEVCLKKNRIAQECPICDKEMWASLIGYFTVIDMGDVKRDADGKISLEGWTSDKGTVYQFGKKLFGAKRGGRDKPGILRKIARLAEKHGGIRGCVFDIYRSGNKVESCGDEWEFVEKISPEDFQAYLKGAGASDEHVADLEAINYGEAFEPKTVEQLKALVSGGGAGASFGGNSGFGASSQAGGKPDWKKWG